MRLALAFAASLAVAMPAAAQDTRTYFTARPYAAAVPGILSAEDRAYYNALFAAIEDAKWAEVAALLQERSDGPLHNVALAEYYLAATSPRVELPQIEQWLQSGTRLPQAEQLVRLGMTRGLEEAPRLPEARDMVPQSPMPRRGRPRSVNDGTMPADIASAIQQHIVDDDPDGARLLLDGIDASLSGEARAEWRQKVAWSYFIENADAAALALAQTVAAGSGAWVAEGDFTAGLAAWRLGDCELALTHFRQAAFGAVDVSLRSASLYWAHRAAMRCRQPGLATQLLQDAAGSDTTFYGMLAAQALGRELPKRVENADFTDDDWRKLRGLDEIRQAVALNEIGRDILASQLLMHTARTSNPDLYEPLSRLARALGFPRTQIAMALSAPRGGKAHQATHFPATPWVPEGGWRVDPALAHAHILQESVFMRDAVSPARAQGLMQITPPTVQQHAPCIGRSASASDVFDPQTNLALGQCNLQMLQDTSSTRDKLPKIIAAYNAGLTPVTRWEGEINDQGDPLLWMEAIPYWETRYYTQIVMGNYWMYERQAGARSMSRVALAQNVWPAFPGEGTRDGRVWLSSGAGQ